MEGLVYGHHVLFFVVVFRAENFIHQISFARQKNQPFAVFVQSSNRENAFGMTNKINDVVLFSKRICGRNDSYGLVKGNVNVLLLRLSDQLPIYAYLILWKDLSA